MSETSRSRISVVRSVLVFALLGPLLFSVPTGLVAGSASGHIGMSLAVIGFGYLIGFVPAALAGVVFHWLAGRFGSRLTAIRRRGAILLGAIAGAVPGIVMGTGIHLISSGTSFALPFAIVSTIGGAVCGLVALPSNNSFKPKPLRGSA